MCGQTGAIPCDDCRDQFRLPGPIRPIEGVDWCGALLSYRGAARELVARAKYRNQRAGLTWLAEGMSGLVRSCGGIGGPTPHAGLDVVTWAPANPAHVRRRGFDHGELLAHAVADRLGLPARALLTRGKGAALTGRSAAERHAGPPLRAAQTGRAYPVFGATVLVVDDVITTGATLATAAARLREMGAASVIAVAAAYTPAPSLARG